MFEKLKSLSKHLKNEFEVYRLVLKHPQTPWIAKVFLGLAVGYLLLPFDLIPDFIPVLGLSLIHIFLTKGVKRVAVEAGVTDFWRKYVGLEGAVVGIDTFGESAPGGVLMKHFGFTVENVVATVKSVL